MNVTNQLLRLDIETATDALSRVLAITMLEGTDTARAIVQLAPEMMDLLDTFADELAAEGNYR